jgi:hypothetical protein
LDYYHLLTSQLGIDLERLRVVNTLRLEALWVHELRQHLQKVLELSYYDPQP